MMNPKNFKIDSLQVCSSSYLLPFHLFSNLLDYQESQAVAAQQVIEVLDCSVVKAIVPWLAQRSGNQSLHPAISRIFQELLWPF